jgi:hypothetical protein
MSGAEHEPGDLLVQREALVDLDGREGRLEQLAQRVDREELAMVDVEHVGELDRDGVEALGADSAW